MLVMSPRQLSAPITLSAACKLNAEAKPPAAELLACVSDFGDAASVNRFLGNLVKQVTLKRIPRRDAITLAYICQLLLIASAPSIERILCASKNHASRH